MKLKLAAMAGSVSVEVEVKPAVVHAYSIWRTVRTDAQYRTGADHCFNVDAIRSDTGTSWAWWHDSCRLAQLPAVLREVVEELRSMTPPDSEQATTEQVVDAMEMLIAATVAAVAHAEGERCT